MPYDPQRSHRRPRLADDAPAPIDALLGEGAEVDVDTEATAPPAEPVTTTRAVRAPEPVTPSEPAPMVVPDVEPPAPGSGRARPLVVAATLVLLVLLALVWLRRRR